MLLVYDQLSGPAICVVRPSPKQDPIPPLDAGAVDGLGKAGRVDATSLLPQKDRDMLNAPSTFFDPAGGIRCRVPTFYAGSRREYVLFLVSCRAEKEGRYLKFEVEVRFFQ